MCRHSNVYTTLFSGGRVSVRKVRISSVSVGAQQGLLSFPCGYSNFRCELYCGIINCYIVKEMSVCARIEIVAYGQRFSIYNIH